MAQQKRTEAVDFTALPDTTPQRQEFARLLGMRIVKTAADAYRNAFECSGSADKTIWTEASKLKNDPIVSLWIEAYRQATTNNELCGRDEHLRVLAELRDESRAKGNLGAAVQAEQLRGKASGHYVEKFEDVTRDNDPVSTLKEIAQVSPDLAKQLAAQHGIAWNADEGATKH